MQATTGKILKKYSRMKTLAIFTALTLSLATIPCSWAEEVPPPEDQNQIDFLKAMDARAKGDLEEAADIFNNILQNQPLLHRARLELATTYYRLYDYDKAKALAQKVLDDPKTPPNVRVSILAFIAQVEKDEKELTVSRHFWKPTVALGWMHDTNINVGPDSSVIQFPDIAGQFSLTPGSTRHSDSAAIAIASLNHRYQTGKTIQVGQKNALFYWQSNASLYRRDYFNEHAYDMDVLSLGTGPALIAIKDWRANINFQLDHLRLGSENLADFYSIMPSVTKQYMKGSLETTLDGNLTKRKYKSEANSARDSTYSSLQLSMGRRFRHPKLNMQLGGKLFQEKAENSALYSNDGRELFIGASWFAWTNGSIFGRFIEKHTEYDGPDILMTVGRSDRQEQYTAGLSHTIQYKWLKGTEITCDFTETNNHSNSPLYQYTRKQVKVMLSRTF